MEGVEPAFDRMKDRIRATHVHGNDGDTDTHLFPYIAEQDTVDWHKTMQLLRSRENQYPLTLELREVEGMAHPFVRVQEVLERLESE